MNISQPKICPKCKANPRLGVKPYCKSCTLAYQREYKPKWIKKNKALGKPVYKKYPLKGEAITRHNARKQAHYALKTKRLIRESCESCGERKTEMHHVDYAFPLRIRWYCTTCHRNIHKMMKERDVIMV